MTDLELRPVDRAEWPAFHRCLTEVFGADPRDEDRERAGWVFEPERSLAVVDAGEIVATAVAQTRDLTVPGGPRPAAAVTAVAVQPTHRRRGLLTGIMRRQLTDLHEGGQEAVAALWASEGGIYGRFGYGVAARQASWRASKDKLRLRPEVPVGSGRAVLARPEQARADEIRVYGEVAARTVGFLGRPGRWWDVTFADPEHWRGGATSRRHALWTEQDGTVTGYTTYRTKDEWGRAENASEVRVGDVVATTAEAYAGLWAYLTGIDLHPWVIRDRAPLDDPLPFLLTDGRAVQAQVYDSLWIRLTDVGRALAMRAYRAPVDVVLDVRDEFCPWNAGTWRLAGDPTGATCERTSAPAEVTVSVGELGGAYLGGPTLASMAAAGLVGGAPDTVAALSLAFSGERLPWCPEVF